MKIEKLIILLLIVLSLSACTNNKVTELTTTSSVTATTAVKTTASKPEPIELKLNSLYKHYSNEDPNENTLAIIDNNPSSELIDSIQVLEEFEYGNIENKILLVPKFTGSEVLVYSAKFENNELEKDELLYEACDTQDGFALLLNTNRPEGIPLLMIFVNSGTNTSSYNISYNGKDGNIGIEYMKYEKLNSSLNKTDKFTFSEIIRYFNLSKSDIISKYGEPDRMSEVEYYDSTIYDRFHYNKTYFDVQPSTGSVYALYAADDIIVLPREIKLGDSYHDVLKKYPSATSNTVNKSENLICDYYISLYGTSISESGIIGFTDNKVIFIKFYEAGACLTYEFENGKLIAAEMELPKT